MSIQCARKAPKQGDFDVLLDNGCVNLFVPKTHNQIFCCAECTRIQTNANIMEKYYDRKKQQAGITRICEQCNFTRLSRYNDGKICTSCEKNPETRRSNEAKRIIESLGGKNATVTA